MPELSDVSTALTSMPDTSEFEEIFIGIWSNDSGLRLRSGSITCIVAVWSDR